jgi:hypothetical protein
MRWLTNWWWDVVAGLNLMVAGWTVLAGAIVVRGCMSGRAAVRAGLTALVVVLLGWAPGLALASDAFGATALPEWWGLLSPLTATISLTSGPGNQAIAMSAGEWVGAGLPLVVGAALLAVSGRRGGRRPSPLVPNGS